MRGVPPMPYDAAADDVWLPQKSMDCANAALVIAVETRPLVAVVILICWVEEFKIAGLNCTAEKYTVLVPVFEDPRWDVIFVAFFKKTILDVKAGPVEFAVTEKFWPLK